MSARRSTAAQEPALDGRLVLGRYRVIRPLAKGGMGVVYLGRLEGAAGFSKPVVIKQVLSHLDTDDTKGQFIREARILSELQHPGIVAVLDFGEEADSYVMVLEYVHGYHVGQWLRYATLSETHVSWEFAIYVALRVLEAIHYAHTRTDSDGKARAIIHRDISPGNVLIDVHGNVRLVDFGIARATEESETKDGIVKGKLSYIAPEIYGSGQASVSSDVYAVGVVLYQLITGKNPFSGTHMSDTIARVLSETPPLASDRRNDIPQELDEALARALEKSPSARYPSAQAFATVLRRLLPRVESEVAEEFRALIAHQFNGDLPEMLGAARLNDLDAAWRESGIDPESERPLVASGLPPGSMSDFTATDVNIPGDEESTRVGLAVEKEMRRALALDRVLARSDSTPPPLPPGGTLPNGTALRSETTLSNGTALRSETALSNGTALRSETTLSNGTALPASTSSSGYEDAAVSARRRGSNKKLAFFTILGAGLIAAIAAGLVIQLSGPTTAENQEPRYLLVERQGNTTPSAPAASGSDASSASNSTTPTSVVDPSATPAQNAGPAHSQERAPSHKGTASAAAKASTGPVDKGATSAVAALTQAFSRRQGAVQNCFATHAGTLKGSPQISIRFDIAASGSVNSATVSPGAVAGTSLGQCLQGVAQATRFPTQEKSVAFSIPIVARVVSN